MGGGGESEEGTAREWRRGSQRFVSCTVGCYPPSCCMQGCCRRVRSRGRCPKCRGCLRKKPLICTDLHWHVCWPDQAMDQLDPAHCYSLRCLQLIIWAHRWHSKHHEGVQLKQQSCSEAPPTNSGFTHLDPMLSRDASFVAFSQWCLSQGLLPGFLAMVLITGAR